MTKVVYTLLGEGIAEHFFIPNCLNAIGKELNIQFKKSNKQIKRSSNPSKSKVYNNIQKFAIAAIIEDGEDLFVVGVDLDKADHNLEEFEKEKNKILAKIPAEVSKNKVIIFIPIQAIDSWLLYLNKNNPVANGLEATNTEQIKRELYGKANPNEAGIRKYAEKPYLTQDYKKLATLSKSFNKFYKTVKDFCENHE